jgi:hypothetical protein
MIGFPLVTIESLKHLTVLNAIFRSIISIIAFDTVPLAVELFTLFGYATTSFIKINILV